MSESSSSVFMFDGNDPEMQQAYEKARASFKYFWREISWERRRIVPAVQMAVVKVPFSDDGDLASDRVEHMWVNEVDFDGRVIRAELMNSPNNLRSVKQGDAVELPLSRISDWMLVLVGEVYGGFTVNLMRSRMSGAERREHDRMWGLRFGDPAHVRIQQEPERKKILGIPIGKPAPAAGDEHPASVNMSQRFREELAARPEVVNQPNENGWTLLHMEALAGNRAQVEALLEAGADPTLRTPHGMTPLELANSLGWTQVAALLAPR